MRIRNDGNKQEFFLVEIFDLMKLSISFIALLLSIISLYFSRKVWKDENRPWVILSAETHENGNQFCSLNLKLSNVGKRTAKNIKIHVTEQFFDDLKCDGLEPNYFKSVKETLLSGRTIPLLTPGAYKLNSFGGLGHKGHSGSTWQKGKSSSIEIRYSDLKGNHFSDSFSITIPDDNDFGSNKWR